MSTSEAVVEILLTGVLTLVGVLLLVVESPRILLSQQPEALAVLLPIAGALAHQLGWLMNMGTYKFATWAYIPRLRARAFGSQIAPRTYRVIKAKILDKAGEGAIHRLRRHVSIQRITRGSTINFLLLGAAVLATEEIAYHQAVGAACFIIATGSALATWGRQKRYYEDMAALAVARGLWNEYRLPREDRPPSWARLLKRTRRRKSL
jgi:hypothetical protein